MSAWLIAVVGVIYTVVAVDLLIKGNTGLGIAFDDQGNGYDSVDNSNYSN